MPRIIYGLIPIDLQIADNSLKCLPTAKFSQNFSGAGTIEQINDYQIEKYTFDAFFSSDVWRKIYTFYHNWAFRGLSWAFAMDKDKTVNTTLDSAANGGGKIIPLASTDGIKAGDTLILSSDDYREAVKVAKITPGESITAVDALIFSFASGDQCRHHEFFPKVKNTASEFNWIQIDDLFQSTFEFIEDLS